MTWLQGSVSADNLAGLVAAARVLAVKYYGQPCVQVVLTNERPSGSGYVPPFTADFESRVWHRIEYTSYGPNRCQDCRAESWPRSRLPGDGSPS